MRALQFNPSPAPTDSPSSNDEPQDDGRSVIIDVGYAGVSFPDLLQRKACTKFGLNHHSFQVLRPPASYAQLLRFRRLPGDRVAVWGSTCHAQVAAATPIRCSNCRTKCRSPREPHSYSIIRRQCSVLSIVVASRLENLFSCSVPPEVSARLPSAAKDLELANNRSCLHPRKSRGCCRRCRPHSARQRYVERRGPRAHRRARGRYDYDPVGGDRFLDGVRALARSGRLVVVGFAAGDIPTIKSTGSSFETSALLAQLGVKPSPQTLHSRDIHARLVPLVTSARSHHQLARSSCSTMPLRHSGRLTIEVRRAKVLFEVNGE